MALDAADHKRHPPKERSQDQIWRIYGYTSGYPHQQEDSQGRLGVVSWASKHAIKKHLEERSLARLVIATVINPLVLLRTWPAVRIFSVSLSRTCSTWLSVESTWDTYTVWTVSHHHHRSNSNTTCGTLSYATHRSHRQPSLTDHHGRRLYLSSIEIKHRRPIINILGKRSNGIDILDRLHEGFFL